MRLKKRADYFMNIGMAILLLFMASCAENSGTHMDLSGEWQFKMDPDDRGIEEKWYEAPGNETVILPGSMVENGKGEEISLETEWTGGIRNPEWYKDAAYAPYHDPENIRFPYWLQPDLKYTGAAWYLKTVEVPANWQKKAVSLLLERPHWETVVWVNGARAGFGNSLATPHHYDVTSLLKPGKNTIAIRVDNRVKEVDPGINSHSVSDHTQSNWNGIVGDIQLRATGMIAFDRVNVFPDVKDKKVEIECRIINRFQEAMEVNIRSAAKLKNGDKIAGEAEGTFTMEPGENIVKMVCQLGEEALLWDEFNPNVYEMEMSLESGKERDSKRIMIGLREFSVDGTRFAINGTPVFLRGTLECAIFPKTGYPPTDIEGWKKVYTAVKGHGLNHVRFHSWCPPEAAFDAADEMGVYLQVECSSWANQSTELGSGLPIDDYIWEESKRIVDAYGNHPSFVMLAYGNEPGGPGRNEFLTEFVSYWKGKDNRRVYTSGAGWPVLEVNEFHNIPQPRIQGWGQELKSIINSQPPSTSYDWSEKVPGDGIPVVSHEIGQWCVYPNFREIEKYDGVLKAKNFEIFRESLTAHHMGHLADSFLLASGKLQALCYKADIEAALRTPGFAGFQLLDLHDFPGQGTALVGVLDPFWEEKGYISPEEYSRFCNTTVPLARLEKRIFSEGEKLIANIEVAHFGSDIIKRAQANWKLIEHGNEIAQGAFEKQDIPVGNGIFMGKAEHTFQQKDKARKLTLEVAVEGFANSWDIWVYPNHDRDEDLSVRVAESLDRETVRYLENGGNVLLSLGRGRVAPGKGGEVGVGFSSIFWNTAWTGGQKPHTLGILCDPEHPALAHFPTEYHSNWQWWDAMSHADAIGLDEFPVQLKPIVRIIDDWVTNKRLALLLEAKVGKGKILISGADLVNDLDNRKEARQLLFSLKQYMISNDFNPAVTLQEEQIISILR